MKVSRQEPWYARTNFPLLVHVLLYTIVAQLHAKLSHAQFCFFFLQLTTFLVLKTFFLRHIKTFYRSLQEIIILLENKQVLSSLPMQHQTAQIITLAHYVKHFCFYMQHFCHCCLVVVTSLAFRYSSFYYQRASLSCIHQHKKQHICLHIYRQLKYIILNIKLRVLVTSLSIVCQNFFKTPR